MNLLQYTFFQHALLGSLLASIACGIIGTYIVTRRLLFISGGITHASFASDWDCMQAYLPFYRLLSSPFYRLSG